MSQPRAKNTVQPNADQYTLMLVLAMFALLIGCIFLYLEVASHGPDPFSGIPSAAKPIVQPLIAIVTQMFGFGV